MWMAIQNPKITEKQKKTTTWWKPKQYSVRGSQPFCYCRPNYICLYEVRPPMSSSYIYEVGLIKEKLLPGICQIAYRIHSKTVCDITIQIVTHRVDWFPCLSFVLFQYTPARPPNLIFWITNGRPQISLSKATCGRRLCTVALSWSRFPHLVYQGGFALFPLSYGLGARGVAECCHCHVRCAQASIPATSSELSDKKGRSFWACERLMRRNTSRARSSSFAVRKRPKRSSSVAEFWPKR